MVCMHKDKFHNYHCHAVKIFSYSSHLVNYELLSAPLVYKTCWVTGSYSKLDIARHSKLGIARYSKLDIARYSKLVHEATTKKCFLYILQHPYSSLAAANQLFFIIVN